MKHIRHLDNLYLLTKVIEAGSLTAAARKLGTTRSLISRRLIALEDALGTRLVHRDARRFAVTAAGEQVYKHAAAMCDAADAAIAAARATRVSGNGTLRIGMHEALSPLVTKLVTTYAGQHPQLRIATTIRMEVEALLQQRVDMIVHAGHQLPNSGDIVARRLGESRLVIVASPGLVARLGRPQHPDEVGSVHRRALTGLGMAPAWKVRDHAPKAQPPRLVSDNLPAMLEAARAGMGFVQLPWLVCRDDLAHGRLVTMLEDFEPQPEPLHALTLSDNACTATTHDFVDFVREHLQTLTAAPNMTEQPHRHAGPSLQE